MSAELFIIEDNNNLKTFKVEGNTFNPEGNIEGLSEFFKSNPKNLNYFC